MPHQSHQVHARTKKIVHADRNFVRFVVLRTVCVGSHAQQQQRIALGRRLRARESFGHAHDL